MKKFILLILSLIFISISQCAYSYNDEEILIIFDASTSMADEIRQQPKYIHAINSAKRVLGEMNPYQKIGLRVIGIQVDTNLLRILSNPKQLCLETQLVAPISQNNIGNINKYLDMILPLGVTPLTLSLKTAIANDFSNDNSTLRHIILITDGGESCGGDPCSYLNSLGPERQNLRIDIIAITVEGEELTQLQCIAGATGGQVFNVTNPADFDKAFSAVIVPKDTSVQAQNIKLEPSGFKFNIPQPDSKDIIYKNYAFEFYN